MGSQQMVMEPIDVNPELTESKNIMKLINMWLIGEGALCLSWAREKNWSFVFTHLEILNCCVHVLGEQVQNRPVGSM